MALSKIRNDSLADTAVHGRRNLIINGAMQVAQRGTSSTGLGAASSFPTLDRFNFVNSSTNGGRLTMSQADITDLAGFSYAMKFDCTTADTTIAADEVTILRYSFEGQDLQSLAYNSSSAKSVTVSFYVKGNAAATYTLELQQPENGRTIAQEFSVTTSWSRVELTFAGDTAGALSNDNNGRLRLHIFLHAGSNYTSGTFAGNSWGTTVTNTRVGENQTSIFDSTSRELFITGLQLEVGDKSTPFEHRSYQDELLACMRYYEGHPYSQGAANGYTGQIWTMKHDSTTRAFPTMNGEYRVPKRAVPTVTIASSQDGTANELSGYSSGTNYTVSAIANPSKSYVCMYFQMTDSLPDQLVVGMYEADAEL